MYSTAPGMVSRILAAAKCESLAPDGASDSTELGSHLSLIVNNIEREKYSQILQCCSLWHGELVIDWQSAMVFHTPLKVIVGISFGAVHR